MLTRGGSIHIGKLDYCLKVDEPSTNAKNFLEYVCIFALNFQ